MRITRVLAALGSAMAIALGTTLLATPAQAQPGVDWEVPIDCTGPVYLPGQPGDSYAFYLVGDCLSIDVGIWNAEWNQSTQQSRLGFLSWAVDGNFDDYGECDDWCGYDPSDWWVENYSSGPAEVWGMTLLSTNDNGDTLRQGSVVADIYAFDDPYFDYPIYWGHAPGGVTEYWHQSVGRAAVDATCEAGWSASWELWMNGGTGGWVCTRDVVMYG